MKSTMFRGLLFAMVSLCLTARAALSAPVTDADAAAATNAAPVTHPAAPASQVTQTASQISQTASPVSQTASPAAAAAGANPDSAPQPGPPSSGPDTATKVPVYIRSDNMHLDSNGRVFIYRDNVEIVKGDM